MHRNLKERELRAFPDWIAIRLYQLQATIIELFGLDCVDEAFQDGLTILLDPVDLVIRGEISGIKMLRKGNYEGKDD